MWHPLTSFREMLDFRRFEDAAEVWELHNWRSTMSARMQESRTTTTCGRSAPSSLEAGAGRRVLATLRLGDAASPHLLR
jgi:hypothetical protein